MIEDYFVDESKLKDLFDDIVYLSEKNVSEDGKSVEIMLSDDRGMILSKEEVDSIVARVSEKRKQRNDS